MEESLEGRTNIKECGGSTLKSGLGLLDDRVDVIHAVLTKYVKKNTSYTQVIVDIWNDPGLANNETAILVANVGSMIEKKSLVTKVMG